MTPNERAVYRLILKGIVAILRTTFSSNSSLAVADEIERETNSVLGRNEIARLLAERNK